MGDLAIGPAFAPAPVPVPAVPSTTPAPAPVAIDDTADVADDRVNLLAEAVSRRTELLMLAQQSEQAQLQLKLDRMRMAFNAAQERRAERLREFNAMRDATIEQAKKDDEILKKYISMI